MPSHARGFTLVELVAAMILIGVLAAVVLPRMDSSRMFREIAFGDQVAAALRYAQKTAVSHRRLVCATVASDQLSLSLGIASSNPASACDKLLAGPDGNQVNPQPAAISPADNITLVAAPAGPLYFQPSGAVTSDGAGSTPANFTLTVTNQTPITVAGETGDVE
jgi:prepilin-type N-terminal cleavage/methylation domain-containing protein